MGPCRVVVTIRLGIWYIVPGSSFLVCSFLIQHLALFYWDRHFLCLKELLLPKDFPQGKFQQRERGLGEGPLGPHIPDLSSCGLLFRKTSNSKEIEKLSVLDIGDVGDGQRDAWDVEMNKPCLMSNEQFSQRNSCCAKCLAARNVLHVQEEIKEPPNVALMIFFSSLMSANFPFQYGRHNFL